MLFRYLHQLDALSSCASSCQLLQYAVLQARRASQVTVHLSTREVWVQRCLCGVVWYGEMWYVMWHGMVRCGMWCDVVWCGAMWYVMWHGMVRCGMWCDVVWCDVVWYGEMWCGVVRCGVVWCGVVLSGVVKESQDRRYNNCTDSYHMWNVTVG